MIGEQNSQDGTKNVSTKVPVWVAELLNLICASRGTDIYGLLKLVLEFIIETAKVSGPVPPAMQTILHMLKMDVDWNRAFAFSDPSATMDVAQVTLMGTDLRRIADAILLSKKTTGMIRQNLFWAFIYNVVCIPLAAGVPCLFGHDWQITPIWAGALLAFSSVSVVLNSLRLKFTNT